MRISDWSSDVCSSDLKRCPQPLLPLEMFRNKSLATLFCLSLFVGFIMFALLFYIPLLLQGGFGMTPQQVGLLITPLVVCITLGSVTHARIIVRLSTPNHLLYAGFRSEKRRVGKRC